MAGISGCCAGVGVISMMRMVRRPIQLGNGFARFRNDEQQGDGRQNRQRDDERGAPAPGGAIGLPGPIAAQFAVQIRPHTRREVRRGRIVDRAAGIDQSLFEFLEFVEFSHAASTR